MDQSIKPYPPKMIKTLKWLKLLDAPQNSKQIFTQQSFFKNTSGYGRKSYALTLGL
jgi:hypothetical protein